MSAVNEQTGCKSGTTSFNFGIFEGQLEESIEKSSEESSADYPSHFSLTQKPLNKYSIKLDYNYNYSINKTLLVFQRKNTNTLPQTQAVCFPHPWLPWNPPGFLPQPAERLKFVTGNMPRSYSKPRWWSTMSSPALGIPQAISSILFPKESQRKKKGSIFYYIWDLRAFVVSDTFASKQSCWGQVLWTQVELVAQWFAPCFTERERERESCSWAYCQHISEASFNRWFHKSI